MGYPCLLVVTPGCGYAAPPGGGDPPQDVLTLPATLITDYHATLNGMLIQDGGEVCKVMFEWGGSTEYGEETGWQGNMSTGSTFSAVIEGLIPGGLYHFRAVAVGTRAYFYGSDVSFSAPVPEHGMVLISQELADLMEGL